MRIGVEIAPSRLEQALEFQLKSKASLAKDIGKTPDTITSYLSRKRKPSPETFEKIALALRMPKKFFLKEQEFSGFDQALKQWRSNSSRKKADIKRGEVVLSWVVEAHRAFDSVFELPNFELGPEIDKWNLPTDFSQITVDVVEKAAMRLREFWRLDKNPIGNLLRTAEKAGIAIGRFNLNVPELDAVSTYFEGRPYILLNSFKQSGCRARFDLAHEIGHMVLHRHVSKEHISGRDGSRIYQKLEEQAHWFAGALLFPRDRFINDFWAPTFQCFVDMKEKWKMSIQAMIRRGLTLDLITKTQYNWLNIAISKKKARQVEPLDDKILPERIRLFPKCFERYEEDFGSSAMPRLLEGLPFSPAILTELFQLEQADLDRFFLGRSKEGEDNLIHFDFKRKEC